MKLPCWQDLVKWQILFSLTEFPNWPKRLLKGCAWAILITFGGISLVDFIIPIAESSCVLSVKKVLPKSPWVFIFINSIFLWIQNNPSLFAFLMRLCFCFPRNSIRVGKGQGSWFNEHGTWMKSIPGHFNVFWGRLNWIPAKAFLLSTPFFMTSLH